MATAGDLAVSAVALKYAAYDYGKNPSGANLDALGRAAEAYYKAYEEYKGNREV